MDNQKPLKTILWRSPLLHSLDYLLQHPDREFSDSQLTKAVSAVSGYQKSAVNAALRTLADLQLIERTPHGRRMVNALKETPLVDQFKLLSNLLTLQPLVETLKSCAASIILFGSRADGSYRSDSDFDLFMISIHPEKIRKIVSDSELSDRIQMIIKRPEEMLTFRQKEPVLSRKIKEGIVVWETP